MGLERRRVSFHRRLSTTVSAGRRTCAGHQSSYGFRTHCGSRGSRRNALCSSSLFPLPFSLVEPLSHLLVLRAVARPTLCRTVPTVVLDGHIDAAVDEESHRLVVSVEDQVVQDARWLMGVPRRIDSGAVLEEEVRHVEVTVEDGQGERRVENLLRRGWVPLQV